MTKKGLLMLLSMFSLVCMFAGCNDDDKIEIIQDGEFVGVYKGALDVKLGGLEVAKDMPQKIYITLVADAQNQIKMELKNFSFGSMALGDIAVDKCDVIKKGNTCTFTGNQKLTLPVIGECDVKLKGSIINDKIQLDIDVAATEAGSAIQVAVVFNGAKLTADQSSAAKIETFTFESKYVTEQPVIKETNITFIVTDSIKLEDLAALVPIIKISDKATISPKSDVPQDFSKPVIYTVTSEDGIVTTKYTVSVAGRQRIYSFEEWTEIDAGDGSNPDTKYFSPAPISELSSSSAGGIMLCAFGYAGGLPVVKTDDAKEGAYAVKLITLNTEGAAWGMAPVLTSGSLFTGRFELDFMDQLASTKFGIMCDKKPLMLKGYYKYAPGESYIDASDKSNVIEHPEKIDECAISGTLYEVSNEEETLTGHDINDSNKRVAVAKLEDGSAKSEYTAFSLDFKFLEGKTFDANKKYKLALICSSSKDGDAFKGAAGSTLIIDELEVIYE